jgi:hypothetical protein
MLHVVTISHPVRTCGVAAYWDAALRGGWGLAAAGRHTLNA